MTFPLFALSSIQFFSDVGYVAWKTSGLYKTCAFREL